MVEIVDSYFVLFVKIMKKFLEIHTLCQHVERVYPVKLMDLTASFSIFQSKSALLRKLWEHTFFSKNGHANQYRTNLQHLVPFKVSGEFIFNKF